MSKLEVKTSFVEYEGRIYNVETWGNCIAVDQQRRQR